MVVDLEFEVGRVEGEGWKRRRSEKGKRRWRTGERPAPARPVVCLLFVPSCSSAFPSVGMPSLERIVWIGGNFEPVKKARPTMGGLRFRWAVFQARLPNNNSLWFGHHGTVKVSSAVNTLGLLLGGEVDQDFWFRR